MLRTAVNLPLILPPSVGSRRCPSGGPSLGERRLPQHMFTIYSNTLVGSSPLEMTEQSVRLNKPYKSSSAGFSISSRNSLR
jgi:hypothetical protein